MKKKKSTQTKKEEPKKLRKSTKKESGKAYTLTPSQIALIYYYRSFGRTWEEIASVLNCSPQNLLKCRETMNISDEIEKIKEVMRKTLDMSVFMRANGMPKIKTSRKVIYRPTGEIDKDKKPVYNKEVITERSESFLAPDPVSAKLWYDMNEIPEVEVIPNFISEFPTQDNDDTKEES